METGLIKNYSERIKKRDENERKILAFLKTEIYTTAKILSDLLDFKAVSSVYSVLKRMEKNGVLIKKEIILDGVKNFGLYGITSHGALLALTEDEDPFKILTFQPSKIAINTLQHRLDIQKIRVSAEKMGFEWKALHNVKSESKSKLPDALLKVDGVIYPIEIERVAKSPKRYKEIAERYKNHFSERGWGGVLYLFPNEQLKNRVIRIFKAVLNESDFLNKFKFKTYDEFLGGGI